MRLLSNSSTCKFHPCCLYCQFPVLAISTLTAFTIIFQYLQIPTLLLYLQFPLLANSSPTKCITFNFHPVAFTVIFQYLQFPPPLLPNSITCKFSAPSLPLTWPHSQYRPSTLKTIITWPQHHDKISETRGNRGTWWQRRNVIKLPASRSRSPHIAVYVTRSWNDNQRKQRQCAWMITTTA